MQNRQYKTSRDAQLDREIEELENAQAISNATTTPVEENKNQPPEVTIVQPAVDWEKRYSDLRSYSAREINDLKKVLKEKEDKLSEIERERKQSDFPAPADGEDLRKWMNDYPQVAARVRAMILEEVGGASTDIKKELEELKKSKESIDQERALNNLLRRHPDFLELRKSQEFQDWLSRQPIERGSIGKALSDALRGYDADAAANAIDIYKSDLEKSKRTKKSEVQEAAETVTKTITEAPRTEKRKFVESVVEKMSIREYERLEDEIEEARRDGRFVYDLSGAAR